MTTDQIDLARRLVACPRWRWMAGMTAIPLSHERERWLLCWYEEDGSEAGGYQTTGGKWWGIATSDLPMVLRGGWVPDLTDPVTAGCLLALVREAWGDPRLVAIYCEPAHPGQSEGWAVQRADGRLPVAGEDHPSEAAALVAALEAAP